MWGMESSVLRMLHALAADKEQTQLFSWLWSVVLAHVSITADTACEAALQQPSKSRQHPRGNCPGLALEILDLTV